MAAPHTLARLFMCLRPRYVLIVLLLGSIAVPAQMLDPAIDRDDQPFSYFNKPTDVIGVMDARAGTLISPEGYLYTGTGELMFFTGDPPVPAEQRIKTLYRGYLPVVQYSYRRGQIDYEVMAFAATLDGNPESDLMNFVRVRIVNRGAAAAVAHFAAAVRYTSPSNLAGGVGDNRFRRPAVPSRLGEYSQLGVEWDPEWEYGFSADGFLRGGKLM
jgi:hypothetical protein